MTKLMLMDVGLQLVLFEGVVALKYALSMMHLIHFAVVLM